MGMGQGKSQREIREPILIQGKAHTRGVVPKMCVCVGQRGSLQWGVSNVNTMQRGKCKYLSQEVCVCGGA